MKVSEADNADIARVLLEMADVLELTGGDAFKVRAYRRASEIVDTLPRSAAELVEDGTLAELPGIGKRIAAHIAELVDRGDFAEHEAIAGKVPPGVREMLSVEGVGPKTAAAAWKAKISDLDALAAACRDGTILALPRMGKARAKAIAEAIARHRGRQGRIPLHRALAHAETLLAAIRGADGVREAEAAGSLRRRRETIGDLDLLVCADRAEPVRAALAGVRDVETITSDGPTRLALRLRDGVAVDVRVVPRASYGAALAYFTGSKAHNVALRARAQRDGKKLNEYGLWDGTRRIAGATEQQVYRALGLPFIPPELRENEGELEAAARNALPRLVEEDDLIGDLHVHTSASSDGRSTLDQVLAEAARLGRRYVAITDHSRSRPLGLDAAALAAHAAAVRAASRRGLRALAGVEVDILADGGLDLPADALAALDWVVAGVHAHLRDPRDVLTRRLVAAIESGVVDLIAHPSNRQLGVRDASAFDLDAVLAAAAGAGVALEIDAQPDRLDLDARAARAARAAGVPIVISSDAHAASQLANLRYGVWVARRGWLEARDVLDTRPWAEIPLAAAAGQPVKVSSHMTAIPAETSATCVASPRSERSRWSSGIRSAAAM